MVKKEFKWRNETIGHGCTAYGDEYVGGNAGPSMFRFWAALALPDEISEGDRIQIEITNSKEGHGWKVDFLRIYFDNVEDPQKYLNYNSWVSDIN